MEASHAARVPELGQLAEMISYRVYMRILQPRGRLYERRFASTVVKRNSKNAFTHFVND